MISPDEDEDYRVLRRYLVSHSAPDFFLSALMRLIRRAGINEACFKERAIPEIHPSKVILRLSAVQKSVNERMTQKQMASLYGVKLREVARFMKKHKIKPSYGNSGKRILRKVEVIEVRNDPAFPVPVQMISPGYAAASSACHT